ncbi:cytoplasmic phosphatidylinositol transfer protein 1 isoform X2 [Bombus pyrosoma]|uniref:cytoplasmic phosphatidylinositol transfer protein 1 isoform X2 n=1 Tax=Bombus pyrosoma TaxID=396416 RepID=UPI001CB8B72C|nr:cytoplasmic phosphatidylinositol transfer protein 1 isoform X2 [Bombus pyrosoma]
MSNQIMMKVLRLLKMWSVMIQNTERVNIQRNESIYLVNCHIGFNLLFLEYFMSQRRHGIIIPLLSQLIVWLFFMLLMVYQEYTCSFIPKLYISIKTRYEDNNGSTENCLGLSPIELIHREVDFVDIAYDELSAKHYKEEEDPKFFKSQRTGRGPLVEGWKGTTQPIMCSYKLVQVSFEMWGMQTRVEDFIHRCIRDILLLGHRQAFAWIDEWYDMTLEDVRQYEQKMQAETNEKVRLRNMNNEKPPTPTTPTSSMPSSPLPKSPTQSARSWFSWS